MTLWLGRGWLGPLLTLLMLPCFSAYSRTRFLRLISL
jgi:hypothetical protein